MARKRVCKVEQVPNGSMKAFDLDESKQVLIINSGNNVYACNAVCPHQDVCLAEGLFDGEILTCHQHLWQWKVNTGEPIGLAEKPLEVYEVDLEGESIYIHD